MQERERAESGAAAGEELGQAPTTPEEPELPETEPGVGRSVYAPDEHGESIWEKDEEERKEGSGKATG